MGSDDEKEAGVGVPQRPTLWNVLYNDVLGLQLDLTEVTVSFVDDLALVVAARDEDSFTENVNRCLEEVSGRLRAHELAVAPEKTECFLVRGCWKREHLTFMVEKVTITPRYLGINFEEKGNFGRASKKAET